MSGSLWVSHSPKIPNLSPPHPCLRRRCNEAGIFNEFCVCSNTGIMDGRDPVSRCSTFLDPPPTLVLDSPSNSDCQRHCSDLQMPKDHRFGPVDYELPIAAEDGTIPATWVACSLALCNILCIFRHTALTFMVLYCVPQHTTHPHQPNTIFSWTPQRLCWLRPKTRATELRNCGESSAFSIITLYNYALLS